MTNFEKLIKQITPEILAEYLESNDLPTFHLCAQCAKDHGITGFGDCFIGGDSCCPFVEQPELLLDFLKADAEGFSFKEFLENHDFVKQNFDEETPSVAFGDSFPGGDAKIKDAPGGLNI